MCELFNSFRHIPDVVWSGITAAVLALSGVLIANRSNTTRLSIQLRHDADEKAKERIAVLRREVYLKAVEELTKANAHLASLPQKDPTKENLADGLQGFFSSAAKLQLVAEPKTALLVNKLVAAYGELLMRLLASTMPLHDLKSTIAVLDNLYNKAQDQVNRVLGEMTKFNEGAHVNDLVFGALQRSFQGFQEQASKHAADRDAAWADFNRLNCNFCRTLIGEMREVGSEQIPVLVEIRRDLGLITDLELFRAQMEEQQQRMLIVLDDFLNKLQAG